MGTVLGVLVRKGIREPAPAVQFRQFWGVTKRSDLVQSLDAPDIDAQYASAQPNRNNRYSFRPETVGRDYRRWPRATDLSMLPPYNGPIERRSNSLIVFPNEQVRLELLKDYFNRKKTDDEIRLIAPALMESSGEFEAVRTRSALLRVKTEDDQGNVKPLHYDEGKVARYPFKPFDVRLAYLDSKIQPLFSRPAPELLAQRSIKGNSFFLTRDTADKSAEGPPFYFSQLVCDYDLLSGHARHFPIFAHPAKRGKTREGQGKIALEGEAPRANLSAAARTYLVKLGVENPDADAETASLVWMHALAIGYSPAYLTENADGIRQDWPRIPLPDSREALLDSAALGKRVAALLDTETPTQAIREPHLQSIAAFKLVENVRLDESKHFAVTAGWGHAGKGGATMPGKGKTVERDYTGEERQALDDAVKLLGDRTLDVYLNDGAYWANIPARVWEYTIGGYQVIKKWLSYREEKLLGRPLTKDEVRYVQEMARRIAAILLLEPDLDGNYQRVKQHAYSW